MHCKELNEIFRYKFKAWVDPDVICRLVAVVSSGGGLGSALSMSASILVTVLIFVHFGHKVSVIITFVLLLATGTFLLGDVLNASELASLGLLLSQGGGDYLAAAADLAFSLSRRNMCKIVSSGATHSNPADHPGDSPNPEKTTGFFLGHTMAPHLFLQSR